MVIFVKKIIILIICFTVTRLQLIYGGRAKISVETDEQSRTVVQLDIPQNEEED